jgi:hypothetical protein
VFPQKDRSSSAKTSPSRWIVERGLLNEKNWSEYPKRGAANKRGQQTKASSRTGMDTGQQPFRIAFIPSAQSLTHLRDK